MLHHTVRMHIFATRFSVYGFCFVWLFTERLFKSCGSLKVLSCPTLCYLYLLACLCTKFLKKVLLYWCRAFFAHELKQTMHMCPKLRRVIRTVLNLFSLMNSSIPDFNSTGWCEYLRSLSHQISHSSCQFQCFAHVGCIFGCAHVHQTLNWEHKFYPLKSLECSRQHILLRETDTQDKWLIKRAVACWGPWLSAVFTFPLCNTHTDLHFSDTEQVIRNWRKYHGRGDESQIESGSSPVWFLIFFC